MRERRVEPSRAEKGMNSEPQVVIVELPPVSGGTISGLIGFDYVRRGGGSVSVQARDHR